MNVENDESATPIHSVDSRIGLASGRGTFVDATCDVGGVRPTVVDSTASGCAVTYDFA